MEIGVYHHSMSGRFVIRRTSLFEESGENFYFPEKSCKRQKGWPKSLSVIRAYFFPI